MRVQIIRKRLIIIIVCLLLIIIIPISVLLSLNFINQDVDDRVIFNPININGNIHFEEFTNQNNWTGEGTKENPYIIENLRIEDDNSDFGISIHNVSKYFVIDNCFIGKSKFGVLLNNCQNGNIKNSEFLELKWSGIEILLDQLSGH